MSDLFKVPDNFLFISYILNNEKIETFVYKIEEVKQLVSKLEEIYQVDTNFPPWEILEIIPENLLSLRIDRRNVNYCDNIEITSFQKFTKLETLELYNLNFSGNGNFSNLKNLVLCNGKNEETFTSFVGKVNLENFYYFGKSVKENLLINSKECIANSFVEFELFPINRDYFTKITLTIASKEEVLILKKKYPQIKTIFIKKPVTIYDF